MKPKLKSLTDPDVNAEARDNPRGKTKVRAAAKKVGRVVKRGVKAAKRAIAAKRHEYRSISLYGR